MTIPIALRKRLGIGRGQVLDFVEEAGRLVARKVTARSPLDGVYGILRTGRSTDNLIAEMRGEADATS